MGFGGSSTNCSDSNTFLQRILKANDFLVNKGYGVTSIDNKYYLVTPAPESKALTDQDLTSLVSDFNVPSACEAQYGQAIRAAQTSLRANIAEHLQRAGTQPTADQLHTSMTNLILLVAAGIAFVLILKKVI